MTENEITDDILDASIKLHKKFGAGLLESVYETLLEIELKKRGHKVERQKSISFEYEGVVLENAFRLDMLVDDTVIVELKSTEKMSPVFAKQLKTYLAITKLQVGVVVNFGMSTLKEGFLRFVNNFTEPQLRASAPLREDNPPQPQSPICASDMTSSANIRLKTALFAVVAAAVMCLRADDLGYTTNCYEVVAGDVPHIRCTEDAALDFTVQGFGTNGWRIAAATAGGWCDVEIGVVGALLRYAYTTNKGTVTGTGDVFRFMFRSWGWDACEDHYVRSMGWMTLAVVGDNLTILAGEFTTQSGVSLVGRGDPTVPDLPTEGVIWKCDFNGCPEYGMITNDVDIGRRASWMSSRSCAEFSPDPFWGRACADVGMVQGDRLSFFVNEKSDGNAVVPVVPAKWEVLSSSFAFNQLCPCEPDDPLYADETKFPTHRLIRIMGGVANIDDKFALRYCGVYDEWYEDIVDSRWELNAGFPESASGELTTRTVVLVSSDALRPLPDATNRWTAVEVESINDGSPLGLAYRIYIDGILACSAEDGSTVFRARPEAASNRNGVSALCFGGSCGLDDIVFRSKTIEPLAAVSIESAIQFTDDELSNLAGIIGLDRLRGVESIALCEWGAQSTGAPKLCVQLGLSPFDVATDGGTKLMLGFKNLTVVATGIDPVAHTVTGRVIPATGTRIVQSPMPYMFGINQHVDFGTPYEHIEEYGYSMLYDDKKFRLDTSNYTTSNGVFTIHYDPTLPEPGSTFFSLEIKDFRNGW